MINKDGSFCITALDKFLFCCFVFSCFLFFFFVFLLLFFFGGGGGGGGVVVVFFSNKSGIFLFHREKKWVPS